MWFLATDVRQLPAVEREVGDRDEGVSAALRKRLPYRVWRGLHTLNLVVWVAATAHGIGSGTDGTHPPRSSKVACSRAAAAAVTRAVSARFTLGSG